MLGRIIKGLLLVLFGGLIGLFTAMLICKVVCTVYEKVTNKNLPQLIRDALLKSKKEKAQKMLLGVIKGTVKSVEANHVTIDAFLEEDENQKAEITLESDQGIDSSVFAGMTISA